MWNDVVYLFCELKIDGRIKHLEEEVTVQDAKHRKTLAEVSTVRFLKDLIRSIA